MDNFKVIYKILKVLESAMDCDEVDRSLLKAENFKITENRFENIIYYQNACQRRIYNRSNHS